MKTIYFVRHGETENNVRQVHGHHTDPLSERGKQQAERVADRLKDAEIEVVLSSPYLRTMQTAEAINTVLEKPLFQEQIFEEVKGVSELRGVYGAAPEAKRIRELRNEHLADPAWHYADEENFTDARLRAEAALAVLAAHAEVNILVVTHGDFLRTLLRMMLLGDLYTPEVYAKTRWSLILSNTGVTVCQLSEKRGWQIVSWNDTVHLTPDLHSS